MKLKSNIIACTILSSLIFILLNCSNLLDNYHGNSSTQVDSDTQDDLSSQVAAPQFSIEAGTYENDITVEITCSTEDAVIYYTTDETDPDTSCTQYTGSIEITGCGTDLTINAIAVRDGMLNSEIVSSIYNIQYQLPEFSALLGANVNSFGEPIVASTYDCGCIIVSFTTMYGEGGMDFWIVKLDYQGNIEWQRAYGGISNQWPSSIEQTFDGGYVVSGKTRLWGLYNTGNEDFWVLKLDSNGDIEWEKVYEGPAADQDDCLYAIKQTSDSGYILAGRTNSFGAGAQDFWILKLNPAGNTEWEKTYGSTGAEWAYSVQQTSDNGYIVTGRTNSYGAGNYDFWVLKLDSEGTVVWQKVYGGINEDVPHTIKQTNDQGYILAGWTFSFGAGDSDLWVLKLDTSGNILWQKAYGGASTDSLRKQSRQTIEQTEDNGYIISGYTNSFGLTYDYWVIKTDNNGNIQWQKTYGRASYMDISYSVENRYNGYYVIGNSGGGLSSGNIMLLSMDQDGNIADSTINISDSNATVTDTSVIGLDTNASVSDSAATVSGSSASVVETTDSVTFF